MPFNPSQPPRPRARDFRFPDPRLRSDVSQRHYAEFLDALQAKSPYPPAALYDLLEGLMGGENRDEVFKRVGRAAGLPEPVQPRVLKRWNLMTAPIKNDRGVVTTDGVAILANILRGHL